jgi:hypothetical protein
MYVKMTIKPYTSLRIFRHSVQQVLPHTDSLFVPLLEKWEFQIISMTKLTQQDMTAEHLSLA